MAESSNSSGGFGCAYVPFALITSCIGYHLHGSIILAILDWIFWPFVWFKWLIFHQVTLTAVKETFSWFF